jgi:hypothetical protein
MEAFVFALTFVQSKVALLLSKRRLTAFKRTHIRAPTLRYRCDWLGLNFVSEREREREKQECSCWKRRIVRANLTLHTMWIVICFNQREKT